LEQLVQREESFQSEAPSIVDIFLAFSGIAIVGFGGVLPWARRMLVEQRKWLTAEEFTEVLSLGQFLPGGNIVNVAVVVGQRFRGPPGSLAAAAGLLIAPTAIVILFGSLYLAYGQSAPVHHALSGVTAAAAGLILSMAAKMAMPLFRRGSGVRLGFAALTFAAVGLLGFALPLVLIVVAPCAIAISWWRLR
jgi:chromate transporter